MNGNWATLDMKDIGASTTQASVALDCLLGQRHDRPRAVRCSPALGPVDGSRTECSPRCSSGSSSRSRNFPTTSPRTRRVLSEPPVSAVPRCCRSPSASDRRGLATMGAAVAGGLLAGCQAGYGIAAFGAGAPMVKVRESSSQDLFGYTARSSQQRWPPAHSSSPASEQRRGISCASLGTVSTSSSLQRSSYDHIAAGPRT